MYISLLLVTFCLSISAPALPLTFHLNKRPVTLRLPIATEVRTHDTSRDYDDEILKHSLTLFERCLNGIRTEIHPTVTVPNWQALLGLSTRIRQFENSVDDEDDFSPRERARTMDEASFLTSFFDAHRMFMPAPVDLRLLARAAILGLRDGVNKEFIGWLTLELASVPAYALRPVLEAGTLTRPKPAPPSTRCDVDLGANVVQFRPRAR